MDVPRAGFSLPGCLNSGSFQQRPLSTNLVVSNRTCQATGKIGGFLGISGGKNEWKRIGENASFDAIWISLFSFVEILFQANRLYQYHARSLAV
jgi:hypothetical protein